MDTRKEMQQGQSLVEFAAVSTLLFAILIGIMEFSRAYYYYSTVTNAAEEGARYGTTNQNTACIQDAVSNHIVAVDKSDVAVAVDCLDNAGATGSDKCVFGNRIRVSTNYTFTAIVPLIPNFLLGGGNASGLTGFPMASVATMRIGRTNNVPPQSGVCQ